MDYFDCAWCLLSARGIALHPVTGDWLPSCGENNHGKDFKTAEDDPNWSQYFLKNPSNPE